MIFFLFVIAKDVRVSKTLLTLVLQVHVHFHTLYCWVILQENATSTHLIKTGVGRWRHLLQQVCNLFNWIFWTLFQHLVNY